jgi:lipoprotein-releasing system permease protein
MLISMLGVLIGLLLGIVFCLLQMQFGFITFGEGSYLLTSYPVAMQWKDILLVPLIVLVITLPAAFLLTGKIYPKLSIR